MTRGVAEALREVRAKTDEQIDRATSRKWADRALACLIVAGKAQGARREKWMMRFEDYSREALEHAALSGDGGKLVGKIQREIDRARGR